MCDESPFAGEPADSREAIMRATYRALMRHGYAGLSIQRIADEAALSKSTFYHHFDDKEDLLASFLEFILDEFLRVFSLEAGDDPRENLRTYVDLILEEDTDVGPEIPGKAAVLTTYVEMRAQAIQNDAFRAKFTEVDRAFNDQLADIVRTGVEHGQFADVDPEQAASFILTVIAGNMFRKTTRTNDPTGTVKAELETYMETRLLADR